YCAPIAGADPTADDRSAIRGNCAGRDAGLDDIRSRVQKIRDFGEPRHRARCKRRSNRGRVRWQSARIDPAQSKEAVSTGAAQYYGKSIRVLGRLLIELLPRAAAGQ